MATGTATIDFGAGATAVPFASVAVTGQAGILAGSQVEAWIALVQNGSTSFYQGHSADEHRVERLRITAGNIIAGTGFTIYAEQEQIGKAPRRGYVPNATAGFVQGTFTVNWAWL